MMHVAEAIEFPFGEGMQKREKSRLVKVWDRLQELKSIAEEKGAIVPAVFAAKLLGVSKQRIDVLMNDGRLERVDVDAHPFITERSIVEFAKSERKSGRPLKTPSTNREMWDASKSAAKEMMRKR
jgi:hypothetical protein